jgi:hypothetical protein
MKRQKAFLPHLIVKSGKISPVAKMIYTELTTLINDKGIAENVTMYYFTKVYGKSPRNIRNALRQLEENMLIEVSESEMRLILDQAEINYIIENRGE